jgi:predicted tellurium resistance membrane protein TerC
MEQLLTLDALISLLTLTTLEVVLGIDNVIFVSILVGRLEPAQRLKARRIWMVGGIAVRVLLLMAIGWLVREGNSELFGFDLDDNHYAFTLRHIIMFAGGLFLLYKTVKEIHHKLEGDDEAIAKIKSKPASFGSIIGQIILIDMVFSFDSIITAVGLARLVPVMIIAVIIAMVVMFFFAERISTFIHKHPSLKMLALAFLLMVGFSLFFEGVEPLHGAHIPKGYIYFAMAFSFGVELLNMRMRRKKASRPVELHEPVVGAQDPAQNN